jgi:PilZ domain
MGSGRPARNYMRYPVEAPVFFRWKDAGGNEHQGEGTSRDISEAGAFVLTAVSPPPGADIELRISFPAVPDAMTAVPMQIDGRVLRVEEIAAGGEIGGFAFLTKQVIYLGHEKSTGN